MKRCLLNSVLVIVASCMFVGCVSPIAYATKAERPLSFVGRISVGEPFTRGRSTIVPLAYSGGELPMNSANVLYGTKVRIKDRQIRFTVITSLTPGSGSENAGRELRVPKLSSGEFDLVYVDPDGTTHPVGKLRVK